jgi:UDPglucose 6-dehydrogenase
MHAILMVGTGYVGLVSAACFAEMGHRVVCLDIDAQKIDDLQRGLIPIYEPGLKELVERNVLAGRLSFTTDYKEGVKQANVCFIAVPTPANENGSCNLTYIYNAASEIARHLDNYKLIVNKSTVPVGTAHQVKELVSSILKERGVDISFDVVSNPEFLKEGCALHDCMKPDRIIIGADTSYAAKIMREIYAPFTINHDRIFIMDTPSAEMTKYASNAMLALRISFINGLARLCEKTGANIKQVRLGMGSDQRIGYHFLYAGAGFGGSCFPKDVRALAATAKEHDIEMPILESIIAVNESQKKILFEKIATYFAPQGGLSGKTIAIWGLSFKPDTDDIREAPSLTLIYSLLELGAHIRAYDPVAMANMHKLIGDHPSLIFCKDEYEAADNADAIALVTEWKQFRSVDFVKIAASLRQKVFFDGRNQYQLSEMEDLGMEYFGIGVPSSRRDLGSIALALQKKTTPIIPENGYRPIFN